ncbi:formamidopyrimidine-DNA glycosylase [Bacillus ectoiniformans]|uniref:DNA-formamidopyrimidine glycosylase n=1 Tax=Bacillus ectoiniformans TaxID=1494429 RepID=UPI00195B5EFC|nr:DNA-formamidopyrimidine glycosylase [Bacillus ectoiniformans]MBM7648852.1 formamidopyrimidine-DNA glycosylase [Bacillus ectoiniformans]
MPELPEVETVRRTLEQLVIGKTVAGVEIRWPNIIKKPEPTDQFTDALIGETIRGVQRRGKFLIFELDRYNLVSHLRMEGKYRVHDQGEEEEPHTHVIFKFSDGTELRYRDVRKFGTMHLFLSGEELGSLPLSQLGPEPFSEEFTVEYMQEKLMKTQRPIKAVLLDQTVFVGLGNIYVDEALFRSGIHPLKKANSLHPEELVRLHKEVVATLLEAVEKGGSTIRSYLNGQGQIGTFQEALFVYGRTGEPCKICGQPIEKMKAAGRGTHVCPSCQPLT